jgi:hypothetical protein
MTPNASHSRHRLAIALAIALAPALSWAATPDAAAAQAPQLAWLNH